MLAKVYEKIIKKMSINKDIIEFVSTAASLVTVIGFIILIYTASLALKQFKEMIKTRHLEALINVFELMGNDKARLDRYYIYNELKSDPDNVSIEDWEYIQRVSISFDKIGVLVKNGLVPKEILLENQYEVIVRAWNKLEPYITSYRKRIGGRHVNHFEELANEASKYHKENYPKIELRTIRIKYDSIINKRPSPE